MIAQLIYTHYVYYFFMASLVLLVAMIGAITLTMLFPRFAQFFIAPLVKADAMEREVQAVQSEFEQVSPYMAFASTIWTSGKRHWSRPIWIVSALWIFFSMQ